MIKEFWVSIILYLHACHHSPSPHMRRGSLTVHSCKTNYVARVPVCLHIHVCAHTPAKLEVNRHTGQSDPHIITKQTHGIILITS